MKAYVLVIKNRQFVEPHVQVCWSNTECADKIISLTNNTLRDGSRVDSLGLALRALDNLGFDVNTYPVDVSPDAVSEALDRAIGTSTLVEEDVVPEPAADFCDVCGADITAVQARLSRARRDGADKACQDCVTKELTPKPDFEQALADFLTSIREVIGANFSKNFPRLAVPTISVDPGGQKYLRIVRDDGRQRSVFCFVDKATGDILKADGWKRPAKHARGSIYENAGKGAITPYGVHYITSRGHRN